MPTAAVNGIDLYYETFGDDTSPTLLMVCGLGAQSVGYEDALCERFVAAGLRVVRYDNRDAGLSTWFDDEVDVLAAVMANVSGEPFDAPYSLSDMAADGIGLLDLLGVDSAHVLGASMGGMIAQTMAIEHPGRVRSLASVMSTTGDPDVGLPSPEVLSSLVAALDPAAAPTTHEERVDAAVEQARLIGTPSTWDEARARVKHSMLVERAYHPAGTGRQFVAILRSGSRAGDLPKVTVPTVVLHGDADPLVDISGGRRTAELVPGASFEVLEGMGHDLPEAYWDRIVSAVLRTTRRVQVA